MLYDTLECYMPWLDNLKHSEYSVYIRLILDFVINVLNPGMCGEADYCCTASVTCISRKADTIPWNKSNNIESASGMFDVFYIESVPGWPK